MTLPTVPAPELTAEAREATRDALEDELAKRSLSAFCTRMGEGNYIPAPHVNLLVEHLEALERRDIRRLLIEMPPQHGKTYHVAERFPAWYMGRNQSHEIIIASYGDSLALRSSRRVRALIQHSKYPWRTEVQLDRASTAADRWETTTHGGLRAAGVGGGLTGFGGNLNIVDDPFKDRKEADSELVRQNVWDWYSEVARTRRRKNSIELIMQTRWHEDDLIGRVLNSPAAKNWTRLRLPAVAEDDDPLGRKVGEALWPENFPLEDFPSVETGEISPRGWAALYQQRPAPQAGGLFQRSDMMASYTTLPSDPMLVDRPKKWVVVQAVDTAWGEGVGHDYSVIATWATDGHDYYLLNIWRDRVEYPALRAAVLREFEAHKPQAVFVEDAANGRVLVQDLRRSPVVVIAVTPEGSKFARADVASMLFNAGRVVLPANAPWLETWITEHLTFPNAANDDQVDTTSEALKQLRAINERWGHREMKLTFGEDTLIGRDGQSERRIKRLRDIRGTGSFPAVR